jgi:predicted ATP-grasp superfamily ATP-dependent carboligase
MTARVLVLNCFVKGWNVLKWLAADGFEVNAAHHTPDAPGLFSTYVRDKSKNLFYPNPKTDESGFVAAVLEHIAKHQFDIVLPVNAAEMMALASHKSEIEKYARFPFEPYSKLLLLHDKKYFFELVGGSLNEALLPHSWSVGDQTAPVTTVLEKAGLSGVPYRLMDSYPSVDNLIDAQPGLVFPLMVKTRRATSAVGIYRVGSIDELRRACRELGDIDIIVQENIAGRGVGISYVRWDEPELLEFFGHKRVREFPISGGASTSREPWRCEDHPLAASLSDLLSRINWHGVVMFEFKETLSGKELSYKFLEANPRFWGSVPLAMANGVNFPALLCRAALGLDIPPVKKHNDVRARILFSDTLSLLLNLLKGRRIIYNLADYFNFRRLYLDDLDWKDMPATRKIFRRMLAEFRGRFFKS